MGLRMYVTLRITQRTWVYVVAYTTHVHDSRIVYVVLHLSYSYATQPYIIISMQQ